MSKRAAVTAEVTFLRTADGGRKTAPILNSGKYMPHIVVQDQAIRKAIVDEDRVCRELYQGVRFIDGPADYHLGEAVCVVLDLMYYPNHLYENVLPGASFTIREGWTIIGFGSVKARTDPVVSPDQNIAPR